MIVKNVVSGQPISAAWANSLVNNVNQKNGVSIPHRAIHSTVGKAGAICANDAAFQISIVEGKVVLNAGQIYINGHLVKPKNAVSSYNQFCSIENWKEKYMQEVSAELPIFKIELTLPKGETITESNIAQVKAELKVSTTGNNDNTGTENGNNNSSTDTGTEETKTDKIEIQLNEIAKDGTQQKIIQLVSGSIYISQNGALPKAKDGIIITDDPIEDEDETQATAEGENEKETKTEKVIKLHVSIIGEDGIEVLDSLYQKSHEEEENPDAEKEENPARIFTIRGKRISFIGEDGIEIEETKEMISEDEGGTLETPKEQTIYTIKGQAFSIIGKDGIFVHEEKVLSGEKEIKQYTIHGKKISLIAKDEMKLKLEFQTGEDNSVATDGTVIKSKWDFWTLQPKGISFIAGDGISIIYTDDLDNFIDCYEIVATGAMGISFVGCDKIRITEREGVENTQKRKEVYVINDIFSLIPTDNLRIEKENGESTFSCPPLSLKRNWETNKLKSKFVSLKQGNNIKLDKNEIDTSDKWEDEYTIHGKIISVIAGDNMRVDVSEDEYGKSFTVHADIKSLIEFDPIYFVVENGTVTLKEEAINEIIEEAINEIGVEVVGEGLIESTFKGDLKANTSGTLTLNTSVSY